MCPGRLRFCQCSQAFPHLLRLLCSKLSSHPFLGGLFSLSSHTPVEQPPGTVATAGSLLQYASDKTFHFRGSAVRKPRDLLIGNWIPSLVADIAVGFADSRKTQQIDPQPPLSRSEPPDVEIAGPVTPEPLRGLVRTQK